MSTSISDWNLSDTMPERTTLAGEYPAWLLSLALHLAVLLLVSLATYAVPLPFELTLISDVTPIETEPEEFHFRNEIPTEVGAASTAGVGMAMASSPEISSFSDIVEQPEIDPLEFGDIQFSQELEQAVAPLEASATLVRGLAGVGVTGASGAIDRLTHEIMLSLEERETLVVWLFDQSGSLQRQRREIRQRLEQIYRELGLIQENIESLSDSKQPLLTAVMAFGERYRWMIDKPTADVEAICEAVNRISLDDSGIENVFSAVHTAVERFKRIRRKRNVLLIVVSDEIGDDADSMLETTVQACRQHAMPVYVLGVPAAFGQSETQLKWVDPNSKYDQTPRWGRVNQGPESLLPERIQLPFASAAELPLDSGFGPFALTRLCYQSGGIYFAIHPNRDPYRRLRRHETKAFSSYLAHFFDPQIMRPYRPEYVSPREYQRRVKARAARLAVVQAAAMPINRMDRPRTTFLKQDDAQFASELTEAQKSAAKLEPKLNSLYEVLKRAESDRDSEASLRWQAAYDTAVGQTLAVMVRTRAYNEMLAQAKRGLEPKDPKNNTWRLVAADDVSVSSRLQREAEKSREYLQRVVHEHEGTPWALLASQELAVPMGWKWTESFTPLATNSNQSRPGNNDNAAVPSDDQKRMLPRRPPSRPVPRL